MIPIKKFIPGIAWFFLLMILICLPGDDLPHPDNWMQAIYFDKWVHAGLFAGLIFLFLRPIALSSLYKKIKQALFYRVLIAIIVWALATEFIQMFFVPGRSFDLTDWAADIFGSLLSYFFLLKIYGRKISNE